MAEAKIDDLDRRILDLLGRDARLSNRAIASHLGLVEGTVRSRIKRMQTANLLRFTAITDDRQQGRPNLAFIRIKTESALARTVGRQITTMDEVLSVLMFLGRFNIVAVSLFEKLESVDEFVNKQICVLPGVLHVESEIVIKSIKFNERMAKLNPQF
ncbi:Lrp/AsnC family transcriptional regulator [Novosphingobium sp.]|uniref:Lrp/AsnC family transcriptional regulator n=1 Tax=Novosphingobium sp. TaxID=1874826 RepID=UPI003D0B9F86